MSHTWMSRITITHEYVTSHMRMHHALPLSIFLFFFLSFSFLPHDFFDLHTNYRYMWATKTFTPMNASLVPHMYLYITTYMYTYLYTYTYEYSNTHLHVYMYQCFTYICVCIYIYIYIYTYIYTHTHMYIYIYIYTCKYVYVYMYICTYLYVYIHIYVYTYICIYIHIYIFVYICMYVYIYTHTYVKCVLPIMRCAFDAYLDVGLAERRTPCRYLLEISRFLPSFWGKMAVLDKMESLKRHGTLYREEASCNILSRRRHGTLYEDEGSRETHGLS